MPWSIRPSQDMAWLVKLGDTSVTDLCLVPVSVLLETSSDKHHLCTGASFFKSRHVMPIYVFFTATSLQRGLVVQPSARASSFIAALAEIKLLLV